MIDKRVIQIRSNERVYHLTWIINNICSNHCDYCSPTLHRGANHNYDWEKAKGFIERLFKHHSRLHLSLSGGEPTLSPHLPELVDMFHEHGHSVGMTTNGARAVRYWETLAPKMSYICFSYHLAFKDDKFLEKVEACAWKTHCTIQLMMDSRYWNDGVAFYEQCRALKFPVSINVLRIIPEKGGSGIGADYTVEQLEWLETRGNFRTRNHNPIQYNSEYQQSSHGGSTFYYDDGSITPYGLANDLIVKQQNNFVGWACNIGIESLYVGWDGYIRKGNCSQGGNLFHLDNHAQHPLPTEAELCYLKECTCATDVLISKVPLRISKSKIIPIQQAPNF